MPIEKYFNHRVTSLETSIISNNTSKETNNEIIIATKEESNEEKEKSFRERYSQELKTKKQEIYNKYRGYNELEDERRKVRQQMMRTPGRRGEIIKEEEISKEFGRRYTESQVK